MSAQANTSERIARLRHRYLKEVVVISAQRAKYYTESWKETERRGLSVAERVALAMKNVYEKMVFYADPEDRIAGTWTENFLGVPVDIERGLFNDVLRIELKKRSMFLHILKDNLWFIFYMIKRYGLVSLIKSLKDTSEVGAAMPSIGTTTMARREVNPCIVKREDKNTLLGELLPFWRGKTIAEEG